MQHTERIPFAHATFRTDGHRDLLEHTYASWLWRSLERAFPQALQVLIMPNHGHLILPESRDTPRRLGAILGRFTHVFRGGRTGWLPIAAPQPIDGVVKLRRHSRYVALNGCRARFTDDPLSWRWSTYRDVMGAVADPWVTAERVATALGWPLRHLPARLHAYVSGDPSCRVEGTPPPRGRITRVPTLDQILTAAAAALRATPESIDRDRRLRCLFIHLATHFGWHQPRFLAETARCSVRHASRLQSTAVANGALRAALQCLADERLLR